MLETAYQRIEVITGPARRRRWSTEQKLRISRRATSPARRCQKLHAAMAWPPTFCSDGASCWQTEARRPWDRMKR